jgi:hypothetical protein
MNPLPCGPRCGGGLHGLRRRRRAGANPAPLGSPLYEARPHMPLLIRLDDNSLVEDLCAHYRRSGFRVERVGGGVVEVAQTDAPTPEQERYEALLHLHVWEAVNPDARGELLASRRQQQPRDH